MLIATILFSSLLIWFIKNYLSKISIFEFYGRNAVPIKRFDYFSATIARRFASNYFLVFCGKVLFLSAGLYL